MRKYTSEALLFVQPYIQSISKLDTRPAPVMQMLKGMSVVPWAGRKFRLLSLVARHQNLHSRSKQRSRMGSKFVHTQFCCAIVGLVLVFASAPLQVGAQAVSLDPAKLPRIGTVDERFASYNIEMAEVTGGNFWKPYHGQSSSAEQATQPAESASTPAGMDPNMYQYRPPVDLSNQHLRKLASALGPVYVRVSGTWANSVYFSNLDNSAKKAPAGFSGVLTRKEWKGVIDFVQAVNGELVTSFATSVGTRNAQGVWNPKEASAWLAYTKSVGGQIVAAEFMNEPTYAAMGGAPRGYNAADYGRDIAVFAPWLKQNSPGTVLLGPGSVGEGPFAIEMGGMLHSEDLLKATGPVFDIVSYHLYAAASERCASMGDKGQTTAETALSQEWLSRPEKISEYYASLRDRFEPGKPLWITETADAACGGNPWASTFLDTFRYVIEHASLARRGVKVIMHNTLAASDYGLLDPNSFEPRPNYWATLLWRKLMGTTVLDPQISVAANIYLYAQCLKGQRGGVALLIINADREHSFELNLPTISMRYTLTAEKLEDTTVELNGKPLRLASSGDLPQFGGEPGKAGRVSFAPISISYLSIADAGNANCQ
jgi:heparanase